MKQNYLFWSLLLFSPLYAEDDNQQSSSQMPSISINTPDILYKPRIPSEEIIVGEYNQGVFSFIFSFDIGEVSITIINADTNSLVYQDNFDSNLGCVECDVIEQEGHYTINIIDESGITYRGEYTIE